MITLITGGSKCGKSSFAEKILDSHIGDKIYIATMRPYGREAEAAIIKHREMRKNKSFTTIEKYTDIGEIALTENSAVLLECTGNLLANEMFENSELFPSEKIFLDLKKLSLNAKKLVIVTNEVGRDGIGYTPETDRYIYEINKLNILLSQISDNVIECVYGIPVVLKGKILC